MSKITPEKSHLLIETGFFWMYSIKSFCPSARLVELADTKDLGSFASACGFKSRVAHQFKSTQNRVYTMKAPELIVIGLDGATDFYVSKEISKGNLPNFARLLKRGCRMTDLRPAHPTITPVCWSALQTGATPEINGIVADKLYLGGHISKLVSAYNGTHLKAERFWEAAARAGKTSIVDSMPVSGPRRSDFVWQMEGTSSNPGRMVMPDGSVEYVDVPQQVWFFDKNKKPAQHLKDVTISPSPVKDAGDDLYMLEVDMSTKDANRHNLLPFAWNIQVTNGGFLLFCNEKKIPLLPNQWTDNFFCELETSQKPLELAFRFGCFELEDGFLIFSSAACYIADRAFPEEFSQLIPGMPPPPVQREYFFFANPNTNRITIDSWEFHRQWHVEMFRRALKERIPDIIVTYLGEIDTVNHFFWPELIGAKKTTQEEYKFVEACYLKTYQIADRYIGYFLDEVADDSTTFLIVSDHGSIGVKEERNINDALAAAGLLTYLPGSKEICWEKTRAAYRGCGHIFVNLKSRDGGIVQEEDYAKTTDEIITALQTQLRGPEGESYLAFAVKKAEAGFFGLGGERCGDVVFGLTAGYAAMTVHAEQIPTATSQFGSMRALGILSGPGIPTETFTKPVNSIDLAPTLCARMGVPLPADSNGRVLAEFLKK